MGPRIMGKGNGSEWVVRISFDVKPGGEMSSWGLASQYSLTALMRGLGYAGIYNTKARAKTIVSRHDSAAGVLLELENIPHFVLCGPLGLDFHLCFFFLFDLQGHSSNELLLAVDLFKRKF